MLDHHALASLALRTERSILRSTAPIWPLPAFEGRCPVVVDTIDHGLGVELAFERAFDGELGDKYPAGTHHGTVRHFMPSLWPATAVADGFVVYAGRQKYSHSVLIDHRNGWATYYSNLRHVFVAPTEGRGARPPRVVRSGQMLGSIGAPYPTAMKCLRFELWRVEPDGCVMRVNPRKHLYRWSLAQWGDAPKAQPDERPPPVSEPEIAEVEAQIDADSPMSVT